LKRAFQGDFEGTGRLIRVGSKGGNGTGRGPVGVNQGVAGCRKK